MSRRLLFSIIIVLLITNITTLLFWVKEEPENVSIDDDTEEEIDSKKPVATIGEEEIYVEEWMEVLRKNFGENQLKRLIDESVVNQLAQEKNLTIDEKVMERELALLTSAQGVMTEEETEKMEEKWVQDITYRYQLEALLAEGTTVPEEEIRSYYDQYKNQYNFTETLQLSHILVSDFDTAEQVVDELDSGASFRLLAEEYSIDEETKTDGGYLGYFVTNSQFLPDGYVDTANEMEQYTYSEPFATDRGIAIIYLHQSLPEIQFSYDELKPYIKNELALEEMGQTLKADPLWEEIDISWIYDE